MVKPEESEKNENGFENFFGPESSFNEEFDASDVVNRYIDEEYVPEDETLPGLAEPEETGPLMSEEELKSLYDEGRTSVDLSMLGIFGKEEEPGPAVIKKEEFESGKSRITSPYSREEFEQAEKKGRSKHYKFEPARKHSREDEPAPDLSGELRSKFKDFIELPTISGNAGNSTHGNLIPSELVKKSGRKLQISDEPPFSDIEEKASSVVVNRNEYGEIESIEVYCKCGERTIIRLDYVDEEDPELTESMNDAVPPFRSFTDARAESYEAEPDKNNSGPGTSGVQFPGEAGESGNPDDF